MYAPGPFRADQIREKDPYELSDGHPVLLPPTSSRSGNASLIAGMIIRFDPKVQYAGTDVGYSPDAGTLRAPDISVIPGAPGPGWYNGVPPLAIEYADVGQNEEKLAEKIADLLSAGTQRIWVVRMVGPRHIEEHTSEGSTIRGSGGVTSAPGILANPIPVDAFYDAELGLSVALANMLERFGYRSVDDIRAEGREEGREEGRTRTLRQSLRAILEKRGLAIGADAEAAIDAAGSDDLQRWLLSSVDAATANDVIRKV